MNDNDLFALIWKLVVIVLCILITSVALETVCAMGNNNNACIAIRSK